MRIVQMATWWSVVSVVGLMGLGCRNQAEQVGADGAAIVCVADGGRLERLAAQEVRRYVYLRTGRLLPIVDDAGQSGEVIRLTVDEQLGGEAYQFSSHKDNGRTVLTISGGSPLAVLYGAYGLAEKLGVRFYLHGDVVPDEQVAFALPTLNEKHRPLFETRGIQPFHDFPEGPDWWNGDDYKAILSQLVKMRMNFIGLHCYPEGGVGAEPGVWIGTADQVNTDGTVQAAYPARWFTTANPRGEWGYRRRQAGAYDFGAGAVYGQDWYGAEEMEARQQWQETTDEQQVELFNDVGGLWADVFGFGKLFGIKACIGTETPLTVPAQVQERLQTAGKDPADAAVVRELYEGMFRRIMRAHPLDYYWFWTPEAWAWSGMSMEQVEATKRDLVLAVEAAQNVGAPFTLATCGWMLGPPQDRAMFDAVLPKTMPFSCINGGVGFEPVEVGFARVKDRPTWAIPWLEDDPAMIIPQLWAGRMRRDAADALAYGCSGLLGIHWRTRILGPNVSALAAAAWDQSRWNPDFKKGDTVAPALPKEGRVGGRAAAYTGQTIAGTELDMIYQAVRYDVRAYHLEVPNGTYTVTLQFCEPHYDQAGKRVFGAKIENKQVIDGLDIYERVGKDRALDLSFENVKIDDGVLDIEFVYQTEYPSIAGIAVEGTTAGSNQFAAQSYSRRINCGAGAMQGYEADLGTMEATLDRPRDFAADDFYADWARTQFGQEVAGPLAALFVSLDGASSGTSNARVASMPRPADWVNGPGGLKVDGRPWSEAAGAYAFVEQMAALRGQVRGPGNLERFDYWLNQFQYLRATGKTACTLGRLGKVMEQVGKEEDKQQRQERAQAEVLPVWRELLADLADVHRYLLAAVSTPGGMGNVTNWQQHLWHQHVAGSAARLAEWLGGELPADAKPSQVYDGPARVFVPTVRSVLAAGEALTVPVVVLGGEPVRAELYTRPLGQSDFTKVGINHVARGVYEVKLPADVTQTDFEYYVEVELNGDRLLRWPATAPTIDQSVVVMEQGQ